LTALSKKNTLQSHGRLQKNRTLSTSKTHTVPFQDNVKITQNLSATSFSLFFHGRPEMEAVIIFVTYRGGIAYGYSDPHHNPADTSQSDQAYGHK
jgi:hypothetical protein